VRTTVGRHDVPAEIEVTCEYPFKDRIRIHLSLERPESFPLSLRIPAWCDDPVITLNGRELPFQVESGYAKIVQHWQDGDQLDIHLPMEVRMVSRNMYANSIERGPLVYVLPVQENWQMIRQRDMFHDWEIYPASPWKYGLVADTSFEVVEQDRV
ncbi:glycoside hydrolase family 127 protein, partial [Klebsiella pneumoniae]